MVGAVVPEGEVKCVFVGQPTGCGVLLRSCLVNPELYQLSHPFCVISYIICIGEGLGVLVEDHNGGGQPHFRLGDGGLSRQRSSFSF